MKRPLFMAGTLFVLGELTCQLFTSNRVYSLVTFISGILIIYISNKSMHAHIKCNDLLLFLCLLSGIIWSFGDSLGDESERYRKYVERGERLELTLYIRNIENVSSGRRLYMTGEKTGFIMYISDSPEPDKKIYENDYFDDGITPGRYLQVTGKLTDIPGATNPGAMDMSDYYESKSVYYQIKEPVFGVAKVEEKPLYKIRSEVIALLYRIRIRMSETIETTFPYTDAAILKTMLLGDKSEMENDIRTLYQRCGIAHILAISGLHVALVAAGLAWILEKLRVKKRYSAVVIMFFVAMYGIMTGMSAPTMRAVIMLSISQAAYLVKRTPDMPTCMMEALLIMAVIRPHALLSAGMIMSFMAVAGIITSNEIYESIFEKERFVYLPLWMRGHLKKLLRGFVMSVCINLWMLPMIIKNYYEVPILSLLLNILIVPLLTVLVAAGFAGVLISFTGITPTLLVYITHCIFVIYKTSCEMFLKIPFSVIITGHAETWQVLLMYGITGGVIVGFLKRTELYRMIKIYDIKNRILKSQTLNFSSNDKKTAFKIQLIDVSTFILLTMMVSMLELTSTWLINQGSGEIVFLDVGQGDGSIIHESFGRNYIIDTGSSDNMNVGQRVLIPALKYYGMKEIDCIFISHTDSDHIGGILDLMEEARLYGLSIKNIALAEGTEEDENYRCLKQAVSEYDKEDLCILGLKRGDIINDNIEVIYPPSIIPASQSDKITERSGNDYSLVLSYRRSGVEVLYTGDIGSSVEEIITQNSQNSQNRSETFRILKCPHHGSKYSSSEELLNWFKPDITVISCGKNNRYGHPAMKTLERLKNCGTEVIRTDENGAVIIRTTGLFKLKNK